MPVNLEPLRADNANLLREVNQLHLELVRRKDAHEQQLKELQAQLRHIEHENYDLRFLNTQYAHKVWPLVS